MADEYTQCLLTNGGLQKIAWVPTYLAIVWHFIGVKATGGQWLVEDAYYDASLTSCQLRAQRDETVGLRRKLDVWRTS